MPGLVIPWLTKEGIEKSQYAPKVLQRQPITSDLDDAKEAVRLRDAELAEQVNREHEYAFTPNGIEITPTPESIEASKARLKLARAATAAGVVPDRGAEVPHPDPVSWAQVLENARYRQWMRDYYQHKFKHTAETIPSGRPREVLYRDEDRAFYYPPGDAEYAL